MNVISNLWNFILAIYILKDLYNNGQEIHKLQNATQEAIQQGEEVV